MAGDTHPPPQISVVITTHNEGAELGRTIASVREHTAVPYEIVLVDDGSTDGSCDSPELSEVRQIRHSSRVGVAVSRDEAARGAQGQAFAFLDAHQRISPRCLDLCTELALNRRAIVTPDICGFDDDQLLHGAYFVVRQQRPPLAAEWKLRPPHSDVTQVSSLRAPAYVVPRDVYQHVHWSPLLQGWGGSEASISLKAFFAGIEILHLCGPVARHQFKKKFHYQVDWTEVWRNQAIVVRICFDERTWYDYWLPEVFSSNLNAQTLLELESEAVRSEQAAFQTLKVRRDDEFWTRLLIRNLPVALR